MIKDYSTGFRNFKYCMKNGGSVAAPVPLPGAMKISRKPQTTSRALSVRLNDGSIVTYTEILETATAATLSIVSLPDEFLIDVLGYFRAEDGSLYEGRQPVAHFTLLYETQGFTEPTRHRLFDCVCSKPSFDVTSMGSTPSIDTRSLELFINPDIVMSGKAYYEQKIRRSENAKLYDTWFGMIPQGE